MHTYIRRTYVRRMYVCMEICQNLEDGMLSKAWGVNNKITNVHVFEFETLGVCLQS